MEATVKPSARLDHLDAERFRDMVQSPPFALLADRLKSCLEQARTDCERWNEPREIHRAQGAISAFRTAMALPEVILKEITRPDAVR